MISLINYEDDIRHSAVINYLLKKSETTTINTDSRVIASNELLTYVATDGLQYTLRHDKFKDTVINKCNVIKARSLYNTDNTYYNDLVATCTSLLALLYSPLATATTPAPAPAPAPTPKLPTPTTTTRSLLSDPYIDSLIHAAMATSSNKNKDQSITNNNNTNNNTYTPPNQFKPRRSPRLAKKQRIVYTS